MTAIQKIILSVMAVILAVMVCAAVYLAVFWDPGTVRGEFIAPDFDPAAVSGAPESIPDDRGYGTLTLNADAVVSLCANIHIENNAAQVYFSSNEENVGWFKIKLCDAKGNLLGESGLLRPGMFIPSVLLSEVPSSQTLGQIKILIYEPETYLSLGSAQAQVMLIPEP